MYFSGLSIATPCETAFHFYQVGERYKHIPSTYEVGWCISVGHVAKLDMVEAQPYFRKTAEAVHAAAMREYGFHLLHSGNVKRNCPKAVQLLERAHKSGDPEAEAKFSTCYKHGLVLYRNLKKVFDIKLRAYEAGALWSDEYVARHYEEGIGTDQDLVKAAEIYRRIYERGGSDGKVDQARCAMCLIRGRGVKQDISRGLHILKGALDDGICIGWRWYGECFRFGYGIEKDAQKAVHCFTKACSASIGETSRAQAHFHLAEMYESGKCLPLHPGKAVRHYQYAVDHLIVPAEMKMGILWETGKGIEQQKYRAFHYFHLLARNGHVEGQKKARKGSVLNVTGPMLSDTLLKQLRQEIQRQRKCCGRPKTIFFCDCQGERRCSWVNYLAD